MRPVINSQKRIVQQSLSSVSELGTGFVDIVDTKNAPTASASNEVVTGTVIKAVYVEMWLNTSSQEQGTATAIIFKAPSTSTNPGTASMADLNSWAGKKDIYEMHQGLLADDNANPIPVFRGWIKIPKSKQRFGLGDRLVFGIRSISGTTQFCGHFIFKAYN